MSLQNQQDRVSAIIVDGRQLTVQLAYTAFGLPNKLRCCREHLVHIVAAWLFSRTAYSCFAVVLPYCNAVSFTFIF